VCQTNFTKGLSFHVLIGLLIIGSGAKTGRQL